MNRIIATILLSFAVAVGALAQDINKVFLKMPRDIIYGLSPELNEMLLDNPSDTSKFVATAIYDNIKRKALNADFISLGTSKIGTTSIRLLPLINESKIICVVQTVDGSTVADSKILFYTDKWEPVDGSDLLPQQRDINWFIKPDVDQSSEKFKHAIAAITMLPMKYTLSDTELTLSVEFYPNKFLSMDDYKALEPFLTNEPKVLKWDKVRFK